MKRYIKPSLIIFIAFLIVGSCNGSGGSNTTTRTIGPEGGTVRSSDGKLTLEIPAGALTEDTEITIRKINPEDLPPELEGTDPNCVYELEPDGLEFMQPITVRAELDIETTQDGDLISAELSDFNLLILSGNVVEVLEKQTQNNNLDTKTATITGELSHFTIIEVIQNIPDPANRLVKDDPNFDSPKIILKFEELPCQVDVDEPFRFGSVLEIELGDQEANASKIMFNSTEISVIDSSDEAFTSQETEFTSTFLLTSFVTQYICNEDGTHKFKLRISLPYQVEVAPGDFDLFLFDHVIEKEITCVAPGMGTPSPPPPPPTPQPTPPSPTEPPVIPTFGALNIDGTWSFNCPVITEAFPLIIPNLGDPIIFDAELIVIPETLELMILPEGGIFTLDGILVPQPNGDFLYNGSGSGFLGDTSPNAANIQIEAEDWIFSQDVPGSFGGNNQPGDIFVDDGLLILNFPNLLLPNQSSIANCDGMRTGD